MARLGGRRPAIIGIVAAVLSAVLLADGYADLATTLPYLLCTVLVIATATAVTIDAAVRFGRNARGRGDRPGFVEFGLLIGLFVVSPLALSAAFAILDTLLGLR